MSALNVQVISSVNIFPESRSRERRLESIPLSIVDNSVAGYARCAAVWFYHPSQALNPTHLQKSLSKTLNYYPQWCGRLSYTTLKANCNHNERYQRIWITYNSPEDIGIPFVTVTSPNNLSEFLPDKETRRTSMKAWDGSKLPSSNLLPSTQLAICSDHDAPNIIIQNTTFACGSIAIAITITHCLADAISLSQFAKDWSSTSRALLSNLPAPILSPIFDPQRLDCLASGDIDASSADSLIQSQARKLPQHRYSWYQESPAQPKKPSIPLDFDTTVALSPSDPIPWEQWDYNAPIAHRVLHFSQEEITNLYQHATTGATSQIQISKHDALLAHIWSLIATSRNLEPGKTSWLDMTLGLRARVTPPLPSNFLGSPITHAAIPYQITEQDSGSPALLSTLATQIRTTMLEFTPAAISHFLHDRAFEYAPQRLWSACLGREHVLLTTWVHSSVYNVLFEDDGESPLYVAAVMPYCDGLVEVMEAPPRDGGRGKGKGESWIDNGVDVSVYLEEKAMERLLANERLWRLD